jgi:type I restriction enzyme S subunit
MNALLEAGYQGVRVNQLVVHAMDAFAGAIGVSDSNGKCTPEYVVLNARREDINLNYYALVLREMARLDFIRIVCPAVRERAPRLRYPNLASMYLPVPDMETQERIVHLARNLDAKVNKFIRNKRRLIELLKEQKQNIINQAVTRGLDPNVKLKPSGVEWIGDIPEHWETRKLKHIASMRSGDNLTSSQIAEAGIFPVYGGNGLRGYYHDYNKEGKYLLVGRQGALCGNVHRVEGKFWATEHAVVTEVRKGISPDWYYYMLNAMNLNQYSESAAQPGISVEKVQNLRTALPNLEEQISIVFYIEHETLLIDNAIARTTREIDLIREYRAHLIADVVTGQVDVRHIAVPEIAGEDFTPLDEDDADAEDLLDETLETEDAA